MASEQSGGDTSFAVEDGEVVIPAGQPTVRLSELTPANTSRMPRSDAKRSPEGLNGRRPDTSTAAQARPAGMGAGPAAVGRYLRQDARPRLSDGLSVLPLHRLCECFYKPASGPSSHVQLSRRCWAATRDVGSPVATLLYRAIVRDLTQRLPLSLGDVQLPARCGLTTVVLLQGVPDLIEMHHLIVRVVHRGPVASEGERRRGLRSAASLMAVMKRPCSVSRSALVSRTTLPSLSVTMMSGELA